MSDDTPDLPAIDRALARDDGGPAFPQSEGVEVGQDRVPGMSLRDWFAGQAFSIFAHPTWPKPSDAAVIAVIAYAIADALIAERKR